MGGRGKKEVRKEEGKRWHQLGRFTFNVFAYLLEVFFRTFLLLGEEGVRRDAGGRRGLEEEGGA